MSVCVGVCVSLCVSVCSLCTCTDCVSVSVTSSVAALSCRRKRAGGGELRARVCACARVQSGSQVRSEGGCLTSDLSDETINNQAVSI